MSQIIASPQLGFSEALNASTSKIFQFTGRSRRSEFWWTQVLVFLVSLVLTPLAGFVAEILTIPLIFRRLHDIGRSGWWYGVLFILKALFFVSLIFDVVMAAINTDHLQGYEEEVAFAMLTKYLVWIGVITVYHVLLLVFFCTDSEQEENRYGESPKYKEVDDLNGEMNYGK